MLPQLCQHCPTKDGRHIFYPSECDPSVKGGGEDHWFRGLIYNYVEAFGERLNDKNLYWAYCRVGKSFRGQLEGLFLILTEAGRANKIVPPDRPSKLCQPQTYPLSHWTSP
jgi:hypothetical protein